MAVGLVGLGSVGQGEKEGEERTEETRPRISYPRDVWPVWSRDGQQLVFVTTRNPVNAPTGATTLCLLDMKTLAIRPVAPWLYRLSEPSWSPDGQQIVCQSAFRLWTIDVATGRMRPLTYGRGYEQSPSWSPTGPLIAYTSNYQSEDREVFLLDLAKRGREEPSAHRLLRLPHAELQPEWSPDGKYLAFIHDRLGDSEPRALEKQDVMVVALDQLHPSEPRVVLQNDQPIDRIAWFSDSRRILVTHLYDMENKCFHKIVDIETAEFVPVEFPPDTPADGARDAVPFPDSQAIIFAQAGEPDGAYLWRADLTGKNIERLTFPPNRYRYDAETGWFALESAKEETDQGGEKAPTDKKVP